MRKLLWTVIVWTVCPRPWTVSGFPVTHRLIEEAVDEDLDILDSVREHGVPNDLHDLQAARATVVEFREGPEPMHRRSRHRRRRLHWTREMLLYLHRYGYMDGVPVYGREIIRDRLKAFQKLAGITATGAIDRPTIAAIRLPRCGNVDLGIIDNQTPELTTSRRKKRFVQISKWRNKVDQSDKLHLQWFIQKYTDDIPKQDIRRVVKQAFTIWEKQTQIPALRTVKLAFKEAKSNEEADISIMWAVENHGDNYPFDKNGKDKKTNILAHTFYPNYRETGTLNGDIHLDDDETWVLDNSSSSSANKKVHFPYVLVHEIGHALGLGHSRRQEAVMNPIYKKNSLESIELDIDDQCAINWNYVGPSSTCLYVWLLVELMPRAAESNSSKVLVATVYSRNGESEEMSNQIWKSEDSFQQRLNITMQSLADARIPQCTESNDIQTKYETLLQQNLAFSSRDARKFGPMVCNFLDGFSRFRGSVANVKQSDDISVAIPNVHTYSHDSPQRLRRRRALFDTEHRQRRSMPDLDLEKDKLDPSKHFNNKFFEDLLTMFVQRTRKV